MPKSKKQIIERMNQVGMTTRFCNGSCPAQRVDRVGEIDEEKRMVPFVMVSSENAGERYDWWDDEIFVEELDIKGASWDRLRTFFKDHRKVVDNAIGRVENIREDNAELKCDVVFGSDDDSDSIFRKYVDGILSDVSIGYYVRDIVVTDKKGEPKHVLVTDFEIRELSAVWMGFDAGAGVGRGARESNPLLEYDRRDVSVMMKQLKLKEKEC